MSNTVSCGALQRAGETEGVASRSPDYHVAADLCAALSWADGARLSGDVVASALTLVTPYLVKVAIDEHITHGNLAGLNQSPLWTTLAFIGIYLTTAWQRYILAWWGKQAFSARPALSTAPISVAALS